MKNKFLENRESVHIRMAALQSKLSENFKLEDTLKVDLHCHDLNSDRPTEMVGRLLQARETWVPTKTLIARLKSSGAVPLVITNHNNIKSVVELKNEGADMIIGAEFSCVMPEENTTLHVLTYGFTVEEEDELNNLRKNIYDFLAYCKEKNIVTVCAHPLFHYTRSEEKAGPKFFKKLALIFERFEINNGQRDTYQNLVAAEWLTSLTPEILKEYGKETRISPDTYCVDPYRKTFVGGSDDHMAIYVGTSGTLVHIPNLKERQKKETTSALVLEALREGRIAPYGQPCESEKLTVSFIDYFCQMVIHLEMPGLVRMLLHDGSKNEKLIALVIVNAIGEIRRHKLTQFFLEAIHNAFNGKKIPLKERIFANKDYHKTIEALNDMADVIKNKPEETETAIRTMLSIAWKELFSLLLRRATNKITELAKNLELNEGSFQEIVTSLLENIEISAYVRDWTAVDKNAKSVFKATGVADNVKTALQQPAIDPGKFFDGLSFPLLATAVLGGATFAGAKVMNLNRNMIGEFAKKFHTSRYPEKVLWLSDTWMDKNGIAMSLQHYREMIIEQNLQIDMLVCSDTAVSDSHLIVLKPAATITIPFYQNQTLRIPDPMEVQRVFVDGGYDRIICSTEGPMGLMTLYLKTAYSIPAFFFLHTDWIEFARRNLKLNAQLLSRLRRIARWYYQRFDGIFVLNEENQKWLTSDQMKIAKGKVHKIGHWIDTTIFYPVKNYKEVLNDESWFEKVSNSPFLLYAGRLSEEKGGAILPELYKRCRKQTPDIKIVIAGSGPMESVLREKMPNAIFTGWLAKEKLSSLYSAATIMVLPSKFDTFGRVILESLACGCPVAAFDTKGPADIVVDGECGILRKKKTEFVDAIAKLLTNPAKLKSMRIVALKRAKYFSKDKMSSVFTKAIGL